jgi:cell division protein FtsI (penicillin-binding protein 3)
MIPAAGRRGPRPDPGQSHSAAAAGPTQGEAHRRRALETARTRLLAAGLLFAFAFLVVAGRLVDLTVFGGEGRATVAASAASIGRGNVVDRTGQILATSLPTPSVYADPKDILDVDAAVRDLAQVFPDLDRQALKARLAGPGRFVWVRRMITWDEKERVNRLGIPGIAFATEPRRYYPNGRAAAHIVGLTDVDGRGTAGVEQSFDALLARGETVHLSIDIRVQQLVRKELEQARREFNAIGAAGLVYDVETGEALAMVSLPDFDPNTPITDPTDDARFNRITKGVYEMGSTFKVFTVAMALDAGATTLRGGYDASRPLRISRFTISDYHAKGRWLSTPEVLIHSSNIGSALMALDVGTSRQKQYLQRFGLLSRAPIELPEVGVPLAPDPWREINTMTIAFGHGLAVTPLNLVAGVAAVVNGGVLRRPTIIRQPDGEPVGGSQAINARTSKQMCDLMRLVVEFGTGAKAEVDGYAVGGKTGTAEKLGGGRYLRNARIASFVGAFPMTAPRYVVLAMLDEPKGNRSTYNYATGGWVAAPVVGRIVRQMAPLLGMPPMGGTEAAQPAGAGKQVQQRPKITVREAIARVQGKQFAAN